MSLFRGNFQCCIVISALQADFLNLFRQGGRLGFTIERDGFVSGVLEHAMDNGLQPGCRIVQVRMYVLYAYALVHHLTLLTFHFFLPTNVLW